MLRNCLNVADDNMKEKEYPVLKVTNVDWDKDHEEIEKLPTDFQLQWGS